MICNARLRVTFLFFLGLVMSASPTALADSDIDRIARQFRDYCLQESTGRGERLLDDVNLPTTKISEAITLSNSIQPDGSWSDIEYSGKGRSSWEPFKHLTRVLSILVYARRSDTPPDETHRCIAAVHKALVYWGKHDFQCPNWWYNQIGVPKILGNIAIVLGDDLQPAERTYITTIPMGRVKIGAMTGQNRVWLAGNGLMDGILRNDPAIVQKAAEVISAEIRVSDAEGIQPDWSFHQHGPQQQFGNYGMAFAVEMARWATILKGTSAAFVPEKMTILRNYLLKGQNVVTWHDAMDISACGRQLFPDSPRQKAGAMRGVMQAMAQIDPDSASDYLAFVTRNSPSAVNDLVGNFCFWRSDYIVHRRADWAISLKMHSNRVIGGELVNSENLSGLHLCDGATFIYRTGDEYQNIFPVWDWRQLPGTTAALDHSSLKPQGEQGLAQSTSFVGGVSDGIRGCAAMDLHRESLSAKKAWFFAGDVVVCLGTDITDSKSSPVVTSINQCLLKGPVMIQSHGKSAPLSSSKATLTDAEWIEHDGIRYTLLAPQSVTITAGPQSGNWARVFETPATPKADVTKDVFALGIDNKTLDGNYAYSISPAGNAKQQEINIISNTAGLQAVTVGLHWSAAIFWTPSSVHFGNTSVTVDQPCVLIVNSTNGDQHITLADPTHKLKALALTVNAKSQTVNLPAGPEAGKSVKMTVPG